MARRSSDTEFPGAGISPEIDLPQAFGFLTASAWFPEFSIRAGAHLSADARGACNAIGVTGAGVVGSACLSALVVTFAPLDEKCSWARTADLSLVLSRQLTGMP